MNFDENDTYYLMKCLNFVESQTFKCLNFVEIQTFAKPKMFEFRWNSNILMVWNVRISLKFKHFDCMKCLNLVKIQTFGFSKCLNLVQIQTFGFGKCLNLIQIQTFEFEKCLNLVQIQTFCQTEMSEFQWNSDIFKLKCLNLDEYIFWLEIWFFFIKI